jgi:hypothetical protein
MKQPTGHVGVFSRLKGDASRRTGESAAECPVCAICDVHRTVPFGLDPSDPRYEMLIGKDSVLLTACLYDLRRTMAAAKMTTNQLPSKCALN